MAARKKTTPKLDKTGMPVLAAGKTLREQLVAARDADYPAADADVQEAAKRYGGDLEKARDAVAGEARSRMVAGMRSAAAINAWLGTAGGQGDPIAIGDTVVQELRPVRDQGGQVIGVELFLVAGYDTDGSPLPLQADREAHYRVFNPPTLVRDDGGPIDVGGRKYREDPLAALAEVIDNLHGTNGGRR